jgi:hypothetical protein
VFVDKFSIIWIPSFESRVKVAHCPQRKFPTAPFSDWSCCFCCGCMQSKAKATFALFQVELDSPLYQQQLPSRLVASKSKRSHNALFSSAPLFLHSRTHIASMSLGSFAKRAPNAGSENKARRRLARAESDHKKLIIVRPLNSRSDSPH